MIELHSSKAIAKSIEPDGGSVIHQQAISKQKRRPVILVGLGSDPKAKALVEGLRARGLDLMEADRAELVPDLLRKTPRSAIVVYNPAATRDAHEVLAAIDSAQRRAPVVVLVDESDFGDYYSLMRLGALEYFEMSERPELIVRGIEWAAESLAS